MTRWRQEWDALVGTTTDSELARRLGITRHPVERRRKKLGVPACTARFELACSDCARKLLRGRRDKDPVCQSCRDKRNHVRHADERRRRIRKWQQDHKEQRKAYMDKYRAENAASIRRKERAWKRRYRAGVDAILLALPCLECGIYHDEKTRQRIIQRMLPCEAYDLKDAHPCLFGEHDNKGSAGERALVRDLHKLAYRKGSTWYAKAKEAIG